MLPGAIIAIVAFAAFVFWLAVEILHEVLEDDGMSDAEARVQLYSEAARQVRQEPRA